MFSEFVFDNHYQLVQFTGPFKIKLDQFLTPHCHKSSDMVIIRPTDCPSKMIRSAVIGFKLLCFLSRFLP